MSDNRQALQQARQQKDTFFKTHPHSPLTPDQKARFTGLDYYPIDPELDLTLEAEPFEQPEAVTIQTTTGDARTYQRWGRVKFPVKGTAASLTLFYDPNSGHFFLPFKDATNGNETYGAGRYIDPEWLGGNRFHIDFNQAYSPYCAYNEQWSCPLTPPENHLAVRIEAGEKKPDTAWA